MATTTIAHTPGPWHVAPSSAPVRAEGCAIVDGCNGFGVRAAQSVLVAEDDRADLVLIAAAPELLKAAQEALHEMCNTFAPRDSFTDAVDALDAAILKATGG
jgi:hypothetical protein